MSLNVTILGCGNSTGVPAIGNYWGKCDPNEPKNTRTRSSILVQSESTAIVIDTGPDFKQQLNRAGINNLDAVLYSHSHSDHVAGIDELRTIKHLSQIDLVNIYSNTDTINDLKHRFDYLFNGGKTNIYPPILKANSYDEGHYGHVQHIGDIEYIPFVQDHGTCETVGYRFDNFAYSVDILTLDEKAIETLKGIDTWIVDSAGYHSDSNPVHANLNTIYALNDKIGAKNVYLTSLTLAMDYKTLKNELKTPLKPAFDGLKLAF